jgi:Mrp family chromosome partitioning ATPase
MELPQTKVGCVYKASAKAREPRDLLAAGSLPPLGTGEGKVLLVDVNATNGEVIHFAGLPAAALATALNRKRRSLPLPTISTWQQSRNRATNPPISDFRKFFAMVPNLKASDFDYIIFDMPPINQTSQPSAGRTNG